MIRLIAFDLDNTLIDARHELSARVKNTIAQAQARGVRVTIATGRGPSPTDQFADELQLTTPLVCFQGALIYDHLTRQKLHETRLHPEVIPIITRLAEERGWNLQFETPYMVYLPRESAHPELMMRLLSVAPWKRVDNLVTDLPEVPHKFIISIENPADRDALTAELRAAMEATTAHITVVPSHPQLVEGVPRGMDKAVGLQWLTQTLGIDASEVLAVGDNDNDVGMLRWAGVGVALSNASPAALAAADWVAPSVAEDGAAVAVERYLLNA